MPRSTTRTGQRWFTSDLNGFDYPISRRVIMRGLEVADVEVDLPGGQDVDTDPRITFHADNLAAPDDRR